MENKAKIDPKRFGIIKVSILSLVFKTRPATVS